MQKPNKKIHTGLIALMIALPLVGYGTQNDDSAIDSKSPAITTNEPDYAKSRLVRTGQKTYMVLRTGTTKYTLEIPANTLDRDMFITMMVPDENKPLVIFKPREIQFQAPVELKIEVNTQMVSTGDSNPTQDRVEAVDIYYFNETTRTWEGQKGDVSRDMSNDDLVTVRTTLNYFPYSAWVGNIQ